MTMNSTTLDEIDQQFRAAFRSELPERVRKLESHLLLLEKTETGIEESFNAFYRGVHNIKGNAATFGFYPLVSVCHRLEDILRAAPLIELRKDPNFVRLGFRLLDMMEAAADDSDEVLSRIEEQLADLQEDSGQILRKRALLVSDSRATLTLCRDILARYDYESVEVKDGYLALHRALTEPFNLLITTSELRLVKGDTLIAALRASSARNRQIPAVMLTSGRVGGVERRRKGDPDYVITRDNLMAKQLLAVVNKIVTSASH